MTTLDIPHDTLFGLENLPYGIFSIGDAAPRVGVRVADNVIDLAALLGDDVFDRPTLNPFMAQGPRRWAEVRATLQRLLAGDVPADAVHPLAAVSMHLPIAVGDYVDFYCSEHHATNLGRIFRPDQEPLTPNWRWLPIGYHGRSQTVVVSGTDIRRPVGQRRGQDRPEFGPEQRLDIECELAYIVGSGSALGDRVTTGDFDEHVFGMAVFNDWSARGIQAWEYVPLGPHLGKSFASSLSAWVTPMAALSAARVQTPPQGDQLDYLAMEQPWGLDISLEVALNDVVISRPPYRETFWSPPQMLAQMTVNGAACATGDMFASGTISGPEKDQRGALIEITWNGTDPITVDGESRGFLEDGDEVVITATAPGTQGRPIGLGECRGTILPASEA